MSTVEDLINQVTMQDFAKAGPTFNELLQAKITDAMDAEKIRISNQVYNAMSEEDEEDGNDSEDEITDEDIDAVLEDEEEDEEETRE